MDTVVETGVLERIIRAVNDHDIDGLVDCFADDVRSETPAHPARSFVGREQVRRNWTQIFAAVRDIQATVIRMTASSGLVWAELEFSGHRPDGSPHLMRGVTINGIDAGRVAFLRFYMEPVDTAGVGADAAVREIVGAGR